MNTYQLERLLENTLDALGTLLINILYFLCICMVVFMIVRSYYRYFTGLYKLNLRTGFSPRGIVFGRHLFKWAFSPSSFEGHCAIIARSGGGKTLSILHKTLEAWIDENHEKGSVGTAGFVIDISGDIVSILNPKDPFVKIFDLFDPLTVVYDVFGKIRKLRDRVLEVNALIKLSFLLIPETTTQDTAVYYERAGRQLLKATLISLYFEGKSFLEICQTVAQSTADELIELLTSLRVPEAIPFFKYFDGLPPQQASNIFDAVHNALEQFANPIVANAFDINRYDADILTAEDVEHYNIFFVIPDTMIDQYATVLRVITEQVLDQIASRPINTGKRVLLAIDEFSSFGKIDILNAVEKYRKRRCRIIILFQSINRLDLNYSFAERESIIGNMEYIVCLGTSSPSTQIFLADCIGKRNLMKKSYNTKTGITVSEHFDYPLQPHKFGKCRWHLYVISRNEYMRLRKAFIPEIKRAITKISSIFKG